MVEGLEKRKAGHNKNKIKPEIGALYIYAIVDAVKSVVARKMNLPREAVEKLIFTPEFDDILYDLTKDLPKEMKADIMAAVMAYRLAGPPRTPKHN
ncbi:hypothetical protein [Pyrococcus kukulkanii]|uniref:hypothetical protein n=1 Tax=Pyrococcus kukulkanii TaxID=1609559 RepID=UPI00356805F9